MRSPNGSIHTTQTPTPLSFYNTFNIYYIYYIYDPDISVNFHLGH
jgi:hypothetical protein